MKLRDNKGSITVFVLVGLLFMSAFLLISYANNVNKSKIAKEQFNMISNGIYSYNDGDANAYKRAYTVLRKGTKQTLSASVENSSNLELTKTFDDNLGSLRIYGNSVQDTTNGDPSPTNPVEIQSVGDKTVNIFYPTELLNSQYIEIIDKKEMEFKWIKTSGIPETNLDAKENTQYAVSFYAKTPKSQTVIVVIYYTDGTSQSISSQTLTDPDTYTCVTGVTTAGKTIDYIKFGGSGGLYEGAMIKKLQIQEGTTITEYEPYGYKIPVKVSGRNAFNINSNDFYARSTYNLNYLPKIENNILYSGGKLGDSAGAGQIIEIKPNTDYTLSYILNYNEDTETTRIALLYLFNESEGNVILNSKDLYIRPNKGMNTYSFNSEDYKYCILTSYSDTQYGLEFSELFLQEGTTATEYEPYVESQTVNIFLDEPLRKVGDYADYIDFENKQVVRNVHVDKISEISYVKYYEPSETYPYGFFTAHTKNAKRNGIEVLSNIYTNNKNLFKMDKNIFGNASSNNIYIIDKDYTDPDTLKNTLKDNEIYYALKTQNDDETIELPEISTYEDYTNIEVLTEIAPSKIEATYEGYTLE